MERGRISSVHGGGGTIARPSDVSIRFYSNAVVDRDRVSLRTGDAVWFEVQVAVDDRMAINIRKCR